jgi:hypothetical protein
MIYPPLKPIPNFPGFSVSQDGVVYSSRSNTKTGFPKPVTVNPRGKVTLTGPGWQRQRYPQEVAAEVWKLEVIK